MISVETFHGQLMEKYTIEINNETIWKARKIARKKLHNSHAMSFTKLWCYTYMILQKNPGSVATICSEIVGGPDRNNEVVQSQSIVPVFKRIFKCYDGARNGFLQGCRPFIGLDGCHLKGSFKGILMSSVGMDENL